jgi:uncharacterized protein YrrD
MRKGKGLLGLPVITLDQASKVGVVKDLLIDPGDRRVTALILGGRDRGGQPREIRFESVSRVGPDAVLIDNEAHVTPAAEQPGQFTLNRGQVKLSGLPLLTDAGRVAGKVSDVVIDESSGEVLQYEVSTGRFRDLVGGKKKIPASAPRAVGTEAMIVPESALTDQATQVEEGPPLVLGTPSRQFVGEREEGMDELAASLLTQQERLIIGRRSEKTIDNEDAGGVIIFQGEPITEETVQKAKAAGKLNLLVDASGTAMASVLSDELVEQAAMAAIGQMAGRTVKTAEDRIIVSQGDVVTQEVVDQAREAGMLPQLIDAVRMAREEPVSEGESRRERARSLWKQIGSRAIRITERL